MQVKRDIFFVFLLAAILLASPVLGAPRHGDGNDNDSDGTGGDHGGDAGHDQDRTFCTLGPYSSCEDANVRP